MKTIASLFIAVYCLGAMAQKVVSNPAKHAGYTLELEEVLRFGADEESEDYLWASTNTKIMPGPNGHMFIADVSTSRILEFDGKGKFVRVAAGRGNGPGELQAILTVSQAGDGTIVVMDVSFGGASYPRVMRFNADMSFRDEIPTRGMSFRPALVYISPNGKYLGGLFIKAEQSSLNLAVKTGIIDLESKEMVNEFYSFESPQPDPTRINNQDMWIDMIAGQFKLLYTFGLFTFGAEGQAYTARSDKYKVFRWTPGAKEADMIMEREYKPYPFGDKEKQDMADYFYEQIGAQGRALIPKSSLERGIEKADLPPRRAPIAGLLPIENKALMVIHHVDVESGENVGDIFSLDGKYLAQITMQEYALFAYGSGNTTPRMTFKDGYAYTILTDSEGENRAVKYRYKLSPGK